MTLVQNRKARHEYTIEDTYEAGIVLTGPEVKSIRASRANIQDAYISIRDGEAFILNMHISPFEQANRMNEDPIRDRKLLLHKREISRIHAAIQRDGYTIIPLRVYLNGRGLIKVEIGIAKGKKLYDRRADIAKRDADRRMRQAMSDYR